MGMKALISFDIGFVSNILMLPSIFVLANKVVVLKSCDSISVKYSRY